MSELVPIIEISLEKADKLGKKLCKNNNFYKFLSNIMENKDIKTGIYSYIKNWDDVKTIILFMKIYELVEQNCKKTLNFEQKILFVDMIMKDRNIRRKIIDCLN